MLYLYNTQQKTAFVIVNVVHRINHSLFSRTIRVYIKWMEKYSGVKLNDAKLPFLYRLSNNHLLIMKFASNLVYQAFLLLIGTAYSTWFKLSISG